MELCQISSHSVSAVAIGITGLWVWYFQVQTLRSRSSLTLAVPAVQPCQIYSCAYLWRAWTLFLASRAGYGWVLVFQDLTSLKSCRKTRNLPQQRNFFMRQLFLDIMGGIVTSCDCGIWINSVKAESPSYQWLPSVISVGLVPKKYQVLMTFCAVVLKYLHFLSWIL